MEGWFITEMEGFFFKYEDEGGGGDHLENYIRVSDNSSLK